MVGMTASLSACGLERIDVRWSVITCIQLAEEHTLFCGRPSNLSMWPCHVRP